MALVLSRRTNQDVMIVFGDVTVLLSVVEIENGRVRLAFTAPDSVGIYRPEEKEKYEALRESKRSAEGD